MAITYGPNLGLMENANTGEAHDADLRKLLRGLDGLVQPRALTIGANTPPASPANGDVHVVGTSPSGAWAGRANKIARYKTEGTAGWEFYTPKQGWRIAVGADDYRFDGAAWVIPAGGGGGGATNLAVTADATTVTVTSDTGTDAAIAAATTTVAGVMSAADKTKLDGVQAGATANSTDAQLRDRSTHTGTQAISTIDGLQTALDAKVASSQVGAASGVAPLGADSKVPSAYLPSYVDDVLEYADLASFPGTGETGKIYVALDTGKTYRWSGSAYTEISPSPGSTDAVPEGAINKYFTDARAKAAAVADAITDGVTDVAPSQNAVADALAGKAAASHTHSADDVSEPVTALSISAGAVAIDLSLGNYFTLTLTSNVTSITFSNLPASGFAKAIAIRIVQDATGNRTVTLPSSFKAVGGSDTAVASAANAATLLTAMTFDQGASWAYAMQEIAA